MDEYFKLLKSLPAWEIAEFLEEKKVKSNYPLEIAKVQKAEVPEPNCFLYFYTVKKPKPLLTVLIKVGVRIFLALSLGASNKIRLILMK